ncbi:MAG: peptidylprolyl isomerase [Sulfuricurvum sp.]|uniref:peptidylprolyl isomerase n=1 Tax=Sulfuricurvum sp. TaxID=2025608 RepID=UPI0027249288|nr:peptidylprolyl isomerase [Sulfuricurvum sp.]MDO9055641.1 peptidylprolyl isomerase [Sulfuricurvum sp.]
MKRYYAALTLSLFLIAHTASGAVLVSVNGNHITSSEVNKVLMEGTQGRFDSLSGDKQNELRHRIIEGMIAQELVYDDAQRIGILDSKEYKQELEALVARLKVQLATKIWEQEQFEAIKVDAKEVKAYFDANPNEFIDKEKIHARHILLRSRAEAQAIIATLRPLRGEKLKQEFIAQAKIKSIGASAAKGGDLGHFPRGQMVPSFNDAAFAMKKGSISSVPVQSQFGYHIIYIEEKKPAKKLGFESVKSFIEQRIKMDKFKEAMENKMGSLREKAKITYTK